MGAPSLSPPHQQLCLADTCVCRASRGLQERTCSAAVHWECWPFAEQGEGTAGKGETAMSMSSAFRSPIEAALLMEGEMNLLAVPSSILLYPVPMVTKSFLRVTVTPSLEMGGRGIRRTARFALRSSGARRNVNLAGKPSLHFFIQQLCGFSSRFLALLCHSQNHCLPFWSLHGQGEREPVLVVTSVQEQLWNSWLVLQYVAQTFQKPTFIEKYF